MAQQLLVYRLTGSAASLGFISFIGLIPLIPLSLWGGSITDRFPRRTIILITQVIMLVQAFLLAILTWSGTVQIWHVYLLAFILGAATAVDLPARQAFTVDMVEGKDDLTSAIGLNSALLYHKPINHLQKERVPINIVVGKHQQRKELSDDRKNCRDKYNCKSVW